MPKEYDSVYDKVPFIKQVPVKLKDLCKIVSKEMDFDNGPVSSVIPASTTAVEPNTLFIM